MRTALLIVAYLTGSVGLALIAARCLRWADTPSVQPPRMPHGRRRRQTVRVLTLTAIACGTLCSLAACGGGGSGAAAVAVYSVGAGGCAGGAAAGCTAPASDPEPTCAGQGYTGTFPNCVCPQPYQVYTGASIANHVAGTCAGNPPPLTCPIGQSLTGYGAQCCPTGDTGNGTTCFAPPPAACPSTTYGTPPNCTPIPSCSAIQGGYWGGPSSGCECPAGASGTYPQCITPCPAGDTGTYPNCVPPVTCNAVPGAYYGGNACECPAGEVGAYPVCVTQSSITLTVTANVDPAVVVDTTGQAALTWSAVSSLPGDVILCYVNGQGDPAIGSGITIGPFTPSQDNNSVTFFVVCNDAWNVTATSAPVSVAIVAPAAPPPDTFTSFANGDGTYTFNWYSYGAQGCYVFLASESGAGPYAAETQLTPGGGTQGSATSAPLSPGYAPYSATLYCGGIPDPSVPAITVSL